MPEIVWRRSAIKISYVAAFAAAGMTGRHTVTFLHSVLMMDVGIMLVRGRFMMMPMRMERIEGHRKRVIQGRKPGDQVIVRGSFIAKGQLLKSTIGD